jgi:hypothetical protein
MKKFRLLLLDANIVIVLCKLGLWGFVLEKCEVLLARTVFELEAHFYEDKDGEQHHFDLQEDVDAGRVRVIDVPLADVQAFMDLFKPLYLGELDPGETESLAYLMKAKEEHLICSADKIVFRVLGALNRVEQGLALETLLKQIGQTVKDLAKEFSEEYRVKWLKIGQREQMLGQALK